MNIVLDDLKVMILRAASEKARTPRVSFVLGTIRDTCPRFQAPVQCRVYMYTYDSDR